MGRTDIEDRRSPDEVMGRMALGGDDQQDAFMTFLAGVQALSRVLPARVTLRQVVILAALVEAGAAGRRITLTDLKTRFPDHADNLGKSYQKLLPPTPRDPDAMGLIKQQDDPRDKRRKYLVLTEAGIEVGQTLLDALRSPTK